MSSPNVSAKGGSLLDKFGTMIYRAGSDFVTAREFSEEVILPKALPPKSLSVAPDIST